MATISTSPKHRTRYLLRLIDKTSKTRRDFSLHGEGVNPNRLAFAFEGSVHESHEYEVALLSSEACPFDAATLIVNGDNPLKMRVNSVDALVDGPKDEKYHYCQLAPLSGSGFLFRLAYGFASIEVRLTGEGGCLALATNEIACTCDRQDQEAVIADIIAELASDEPSVAMDWMLLPQRATASAFALAESNSVLDGSKTLRSFLKLCDNVLNAYEAHLAFFQSRPHSRLLKRHETVGASKVRRFGRCELDWLAKTPEMLYETKEQTAIPLGGKHYMASRVRTERSYRGFDTLENRAVLSFAKEVLKTLGGVSARVDEQVDELRSIRDSLKGIDAEGGILPALVILETCLSREEPLAKQASELRRRANRLVRALSDAMPHVQEVRYRTPRRSKVFQEIAPYAELHTQMRQWESFGKFDMLRDGLVIHTWRMDKLYEYYVLHRLLDALHKLGFAPDATHSEPVLQARFTPQSYYYKNESQVANVYHLDRNGEKISLYYEPVVFGSNKAENDIDVHRVTRTEQGGDSCWTPDFYLRHEMGGATRRIVLDAKFRKPRAVRHDGSSNDAMTCFEQCMFKYKLSMMGADGKPVDSLWLLCGRAREAETVVFQNSSWAVEHGSLTPDGIATVAPDADALSDLLAKLGFAR